MLNEDKKALAKYRLERANVCLHSAEELISMEDYLATLNRSYYAIFHAVRAILALDGEDRRKHSGVISYFQQNYVKTGIFDKKYSGMVQEAFEVRQESDYEDFYVVSKEDSVKQFENAKQLVSTIKEYVETQCSTM